MAQIIARELSQTERRRFAQKRARSSLIRLVACVAAGLVFAGAASVAAVEMDPAVKAQAQMQNVPASVSVAFQMKR